MNAYLKFLAAVLAASGLVNAAVQPATPDKTNEGKNVKISWQKNNNASTSWENMSITLKTGDNFNMVPLTQVAQGLNGQADGQIEWPLPLVTPNSAIYFFEFNATAAIDGPVWTTRFAIADENGQVQPPANQTQPKGPDGQAAPIPWGTGKIDSNSTTSASGGLSASAGLSSAALGSASIVPSISALQSASVVSSIGVSPPATSSPVVTATAVSNVARFVPSKQRRNVAKEVSFD